MGARLAMLLLAGAAGTACSRGDAGVSDPGAEPPAQRVAVAAVERRDLHDILRATAPLEADSEALVVARVAGEVIRIEVEEGDSVTAGQVLARLDGERLRLRLLKAKAELDRADGELRRIERLRAQNLVSAATFEELAFAREALAAAYQLHRLEFGHTAVRAPVSGVVSLRHVTPGEQVVPGEALFSIADTRRLLAYLHLPQNELARVEAGDRAVFRVDSLPGASFAAAIARISPTVDPRTGTFRATLDVDNAAGQLAPGMFSRFDITVDTRSGALVIPTTAIVSDADERAVFVLEDGQALRRGIETGMEHEDVTEVVSGLGPGDRVIVSGQDGLANGSRVLAAVPPAGSAG